MASYEMQTGERTAAAKLKWMVIGLLGPGGPDASGYMPATAQVSRVYDDYLGQLAKTQPEELGVLAISVIGPRNQVAKLVRHLELLP